MPHRRTMVVSGIMVEVLGKTWDDLKSDLAFMISYPREFSLETIERVLVEDIGHPR